ncbi:MAG: ATP-binding protein [bacterium]|nr:ATP-binding protein [bacterium]
MARASGENCGRHTTGEPIPRTWESATACPCFPELKNSIPPPADPDSPGKPATDGPAERKPGVEPELLRRVETLRDRFAESLRHHLAGGRLIPRPETTEVMAALQKTGIRLVLIHGVAGAGKSGVLYELTQHLDEEGTPYLPLRLDRQRPKVSPQHFGRAARTAGDWGCNRSPAHE